MYVCIEILWACMLQTPLCRVRCIWAGSATCSVPGLPTAGRGTGLLSIWSKQRQDTKEVIHILSITSHPAAGLLGTSICPNFCWRGRFCPSYITAIFICSKISHLIPCSPSMLNAKGHSTLNIEIQMERNNPGQDNLNWKSISPQISSEKCIEIQLNSTPLYSFHALFYLLAF